jgi:ribonuclease D
MPDLITTREQFLEMLDSLRAGHGPIAIDAERASGYRYSQRAYLIQIFRRAGGLHLIDPIAVADTELWGELNRSFADQEWIIHASTQDLPCLRELGLDPQILFDTELGGRIAGCPRVGLGPLCESLLGLALAKEHSAVDWSIRPLKSEWLIYAALDVDVLVDLRDEVEKLLLANGKLEWAREDFAAILKNPPAPARKDPWRRTSGMHKVRDRMTLGIIRALWHARDDFARHVDVSPGRIFNDEILLEVATRRPKTVDDFSKLVKRRTRVENLPTTQWFALLQQTLALPVEQLPEVRTPSVGLPPLKVWRERNVMAHARITHARPALQTRATQLHIPTENLLSPELLRQLMWKSPPLTAANTQAEFKEYISGFLLELGARTWQVEQVWQSLCEPLIATEPLVVEVSEATEGAEELTSD